MSVDRGLVDWVAEAMDPLGAVTSRAMMGGATLYLDGTVFAIVAFDLLWFKADTTSDAYWDALDAKRFTYEREGGTATMNYRQAPDDVYDDADALRTHAAVAVEAGLRAPKKRKKK